MRTLLLLRGAPGSGKSTFVKDNRLEEYTLSTDSLRILCGAQRYDGISQSHNKLMRHILRDMLESRMKVGHFTIIDACNCSVSHFKEYIKMAEKYRYNIFYYQPDTSLEDCLYRNSLRQHPVPEDIVRLFYSECEKPLKYTRIKGMEDLVIPTYKLDGYEDVVCIGDLHGSYTVLKEAIGEIEDNKMYIFLGDYVDRGVEHRELIQFLARICDRPNVILLEGNHERHLRKWYETGDCTSKEFRTRTMKQLEGLRCDCGKILYRLRQCYKFSIEGKVFFACHGGVQEYPSIFIPTRELIHGQGDYETPIQWSYSMTQIHGHRELDSPGCICLEAGISQGRHLAIWTYKTGKSLYKNNIYVSREVGIMDNPLIKAKLQSNGLISYNFTREAFEKKQWDESTIKARGLYMSGDRVVMRSYNKFFNIGEMGESLDKLVYPVRLQRKENGFLGILGTYNGELVFASKSTCDGEHAKLFEELFPYDRDEYLKILTENNCTAVFEVCDSVRDPHIVWYDEPKVFILDFIPNDLGASDKDIYDFSMGLLDMVKADKPHAIMVDSHEELERYLEVGENTEGWVITDSTGHKMKYKNAWYNRLKRIRDTHKPTIHIQKYLL